MKELTIKGLIKTWKEFDYDVTYKGKKKEFYNVVVKELTRTIECAGRYGFISFDKGTRVVNIIFDAAHKFSELL